MNQTVVPNPAAGTVQPPPILDALVDKIKFPDGADQLSEAPLNQDSTCGAPGPSEDATQAHDGGDNLAAAPQEPGEMPNAEGVLTVAEQDASPGPSPDSGGSAASPKLKSTKDESPVTLHVDTVIDPISEEEGAWLRRKLTDELMGMQ